MMKDVREPSVLSNVFIDTPFLKEQWLQFASNMIMYLYFILLVQGEVSHEKCFNHQSPGKPESRNHGRHSGDLEKSRNFVSLEW